MSPCCSRVVLHGCLANTSPQCLQRQRKVETHDWPFLSSLLRSRISFWRVYKQGIALRLPLTKLHSRRVRRHAKLPFGGARVALRVFFSTISVSFRFSRGGGWFEGWWGYQPIEKIRQDWGREEDGGGEKEEEEGGGKTEIALWHADRKMSDGSPQLAWLSIMVLVLRDDLALQRNRRRRRRGRVNIYLTVREH